MAAEPSPAATAAEAPASTLRDQRTTVVFDEPIVVGNAEYRQLSLRRPTVRDMCAVTKDGATNAEQEIALLARIADVSEDVIMAADYHTQYVQLQNVLLGFRMASRSSGFRPANGGAASSSSPASSAADSKA